MEKLLKRKRKAEAENNKTLLTSVCIDLAEQYLKNGDYHAAITEYKTIAIIYKRLNKMLDYACAHRMIGEAYTQLLMYDEALKHEEIYLNVAQKEQNKMEEQRAYATMGHIYLTMALCTEIANVESLEKASCHFIKSLNICEKLSNISKQEQMDMMARLFANLGVVKEAQGKVIKGIELVTKSVNICKKYDIYEQLERCYTTLSSLYTKSGDYSNAISNLNLAMKTAARLPDKVALSCSSLLSKADILMKMADLQGAKRVLHKAYKLKTSNRSDYILIEKNLKIVMAMNYAEEALLIAPITDYKSRKKLYEKLGDGACHFKNYTSAVEYYKMMLEAAINNNESGKELGPCYVSLAQTYLDNKEYDKAIEYYKLDLELSKDNLKESINTTFNITSAMDQAGKDVNEVVQVFANAREMCVKAESKKELARVIEREILFLKKHFRLSEAAKLEPEFEQLDCPPSDSDSEEEDAVENIGDDVDISNITDMSSSDDEKDLTVKSSRKRTKGITMKRNVKGETQLHVACIDGNAQLVEKLLGQGHVVNIRDHAGWLPIHEACICGHLDIVKMLVDKGAALNDRGGVKCGGMTPLHDACSNGHLHVINYILTKGASPLAKTDNGETPLYFLKIWRASVSLDPDEEELYMQIVDTITSAMTKAGQHDASSSWNRSNEALVLIEDANNTLTLNHSSLRRTTRTSSISSKSEGHNSLSKQRKNSSDLRRNPNAGDEDIIFSQQSNAASEYKSTIELLRKPSSLDVKKRKSVNQSAHVAMNDYVDDWLDDDMNAISNKKRRISTSLKRNNSYGEIIDSEMSSSYNEVGLENLEPPNVILNSSGSIKTNKFRKSQSTLFKTGFTRHIDSSSPVEFGVSNSFDGSEKSTGSKLQQKISSFINTTGNEASREVQNVLTKTISPTQSLIKKQMLFIDVRIDDKLFRIPFPAQDLDTLTIKYIAIETVKRFYKKEAMKPVIEMETKNGAILGEDDPLSLLFTTESTRCEELRAKVVKWNVPPLKERYIDACQHLIVEPSDEISNILDATTVNLNLSEKNYREKTLPICRSLNRQSNLYELNLSGNLSGDKMVEALCTSLPTLTNLSILILSTNHISTEGLNSLASTLKSTTSTTMLPALKTLDLSYNPLGNESLKYLGEITHNLKLEKLSLCAVDFTSGLFNNSYNQFVTFDLHELKEFDLSYNGLAKLDVSRFLSFLFADKLEVFNIGGNSLEVSGLGSDIAKLIKSKNNGSTICIKHLCLAQCMLDDNDILDLESALSTVNQLEELDLSFNEFSGAALHRLLANTPPKRLLIACCDNLSKSNEIYDSHQWKFSANRCEYLESTLDYVQDFKQCDTLIGMFREAFQDGLSIDGLDVGMLKLSINK